MKRTVFIIFIVILLGIGWAFTVSDFLVRNLRRIIKNNLLQMLIIILRKVFIKEQ